jgi:ParB family chromosome partitioning protein
MHIDKEFQSLIPPLTAEEYAGLEESILSEGCRDALVVWGDTLIDGHNRYEICTKHGIPFDTVEMDFPTRDDVKLWMMKNQLARRNLNPIQYIDIVRKCADSIQKKARERQATSTGGIKPQLKENFPEAGKQSRDELGKMAGVSGKTYEHGVTILEKAPKSVVDAVKNDDLSIHAAYQVTKMEPEQQEEVAERIEQGEKPKEVVADVQKRPHVTFNSGNNEWYTPEKYIDLAREVLGAIDLDPASCEIANETVKAERFYSEQDDGLTKEWTGRVWMNPPYSSDLIGQFTEKFAKEYTAGNITEGIVLVNNATETAWFCQMTKAASAVVFPRGRIRYNSPTKESNAPIQGQAFIYFGEHYNRFLDVFGEIGWGAVIHG